LPLHSNFSDGRRKTSISKRGTFPPFKIIQQARSSRILIGPADFPPPMGEVWFLGLGAKREAPRAEARGPKGRERGWVLGEAAASPPPHQLGSLGERCKLPQRGAGRSPGRKRILDVEDPIKRI